MEDCEIINFLRMIGVGRRPANDPFFNESYAICKVFQRKGVTVEDEEELCHNLMNEFPCNACPETFQNLLDYELHYNNWHRFVCEGCKKICTSARLLDIHIQETHDNFFKTLADQKSMYQCFVSECEEKFRNPIERREHCIKVHEFPKNYRFDESTRSKAPPSTTKMIIDSTESTPSPQKKHRNFKLNLVKNQKFKMFSNSNMSIIPEKNENIASEKPKTSSLMFVPRQVATKMSYARKLTGSKGMEKNVLESESIMEIADVLPN